MATRTGQEANDRTQDRNRDGSGDEAGTVTATGMETRGRTQNGNVNGSGDGNESSSRGGNGDEDVKGDKYGNGDGNEVGIREGGEERKRREKPHKSCRFDVGNGGDISRKRKKRREENIRLVAADPDNLENSKKAGVKRKAFSA